MIFKLQIQATVEYFATQGAIIVTYVDTITKAYASIGPSAFILVKALANDINLNIGFLIECLAASPEAATTSISG